MRFYGWSVLDAFSLPLVALGMMARETRPRVAPLGNAVKDFRGAAKTTPTSLRSVDLVDNDWMF